MEIGIILRGVGGIYEVQTEQGLVSCTLRGRLRLAQERILVGDRVRISREGPQGVVEQVLKRHTELKRPSIANIEQVVVVVAARNPAVNLLLLDRLLVNACAAKVKAVLVINKEDLDAQKAFELKAGYSKISYLVLVTSAKTRSGLDELRRVFPGKITTLAGPSGVGKSSLLNALEPGFNLAVGEVNVKARRGRHTTRTVQLLPVAGGLVADTPGFSQLNVDLKNEAKLQFAFPEIGNYAGQCRFRGCLHYHEPGCLVKEAVRTGQIPEHRYSHYVLFLQEIQATSNY